MLCFDQVIRLGMRSGALPRSKSVTWSPYAGGDMTASNLANAPPGMQKQMLGEKIFPFAPPC